MENVKKRRRIFLSLSMLESCPQEINSSEIRPHFTFSVNWNKRDKDWKTANHFKSDVLSLPSPSSMLKLPNDQCGEAQPEKGTFFMPQVYESVRISLVEVNETVGKFVISVRNKAQKSWKMHYVCERVGARKLSGFLICSHLKDSAFTAVRRDTKF